MGEITEERTWALRALRGDEQAFALLVEAYQTPVFNLAYRMLGDPAAAEDAAQETFLRAYTHMQSYDPARKFSSWILSIASHYCIDRIRRRHGNTLSTEDLNAWRWLPDEHPRPEEQTLSHERKTVMREMLEQLPPEYRLVLILRYWEDLSYEEIAEVTQTTPSAVKSRLHRARLQVAKMLADRPEADLLQEQDKRLEAQNAVSSSF